MNMEQWLEKLGLESGDLGLWGQVFAVVFGVMLINFLVKKALDNLERKFAGTANTWDDAVIFALKAPLRLLVWVVGVSFAAEIIGAQTDATIFGAVEPVRDVGVIGALAWFLIRFIKGAEQNLLEAGKVDITTTSAIAKLLRISVIITAMLVVLQTLGFSISGVLAFGGIGGLAVGLAAKDLLANFFGGLMIHLDRPFSVGDWVRSPDQEIEGTVEQIGWRLTVIRTFDKRPLYVPNSAFTQITVENPSRMSHRRIYETIGIRYEDVDKMAAITREVEAMLRAHPAIDDNQTLMVNFNKFAASSLDFFIYTFTHTTVWTEFHQIKQDVLMQISEIIARHGAEIAFPTSTIHLGDDKIPFQQISQQQD